MVTEGEPVIRVFDDADSARLLATLRTNYPPGFLDTDEGRDIAQVEIHDRQFWFRERYVPWIETVLPLPGTRVLEVGTGLSTDVEGPNGREKLARWGRGVSYHDLTIAFGEDPTPFYASGEWDYRRERDPDWATWWSATDDGKYHALLLAVCPELPSGFLEPELAICLRKPTETDPKPRVNGGRAEERRRDRVRSWLRPAG